MDPWIAADSELSCLDKGERARLVGHRELLDVLHRAVALLYERGYHLPLGLCCDLIWMYLNPEAATFAPSDAWTQGRRQEFAASYCRLLAVAAASPSWRNLLVQARRTRGLAGRRFGADACEQAARAAVTFVEPLAEYLYRSAPCPPTSLSTAVTEFVAAGRWSLPAAADSRQSPPPSPAVLDRFQALLGPVTGSRDAASGFHRVFDDGAVVSLVLAAAGWKSGAELLDLSLLSACREYRPPELPAPLATRLHRVRQLLSHYQGAPSTSPECGIQGLTRKGPFSALLGSELVHDDWTDRVVSGQALYYDRSALREERRRVLLAWVLDWTDELQTRVARSTAGASGTTSRLPRRDAFVRRLVAAQIEDAVRHFGDSPALDLRLAVLFSDRANPRVGGRDAVIWPSSASLSAAPSIPRQSGSVPAWLPKCEAFFPLFFLRDPVRAWRSVGAVRGAECRRPSLVPLGADPTSDLGAAAIGGSLGGSLEGEFRQLATLVAQGDFGDVEHRDGRCLDACLITVLSSDEGSLEACARGLMPLARMSGQYGLLRVLAGPRHVRLWPGPARGSSSDVFVTYEDYPGDDQLRFAAFASLLDVITCLSCL